MQTTNGLMDAYNGLARWYDLMYLAQGARPMDSNPELVAGVQSLMNERGLSSVLDASCGTGNPIVGLAREEPYWTVWGSDASSDMLAKCKAHAVGANLSFEGSSQPGGFELKESSWSDLPQVVARQFGLVMCRGHGLYHSSTRESVLGVLSSMSKVCEPGGYILADTINWGPNLRSENNREEVMCRGMIDADHPENPLGRRIIFLDSIEFFDDRDAVSGVIQRKTLHVLSEKNGRMEVEDEHSVFGAPFLIETLMDMMTESGLSDVQQIQLEGQRYDVAIGRNI